MADNPNAIQEDEEIFELVDPESVASIPTEPTAHIFEITDPGQLEALRPSSDYGDVPLRAAAIVLTAVDHKGKLSLLVSPPGYVVWVRPVDEFDVIFREIFGIEALPVSIPWSKLPLEISDEYPVPHVSIDGLGTDIQVIEPSGDREIVIPLDHTENPEFPSTKYF